MTKGRATCLLRAAAFFALVVLSNASLEPEGSGDATGGAGTDSPQQAAVAAESAGTKSAAEQVSASQLVKTSVSNTPAPMDGSASALSQADLTRFSALAEKGISEINELRGNKDNSVKLPPLKFEAMMWGSIEAAGGEVLSTCCKTTVEGKSDPVYVSVKVYEPPGENEKVTISSVVPSSQMGSVAATKVAEALKKEDAADEVSEKSCPPGAGESQASPSSPPAMPLHKNTSFKALGSLWPLSGFITQRIRTFGRTLPEKYDFFEKFPQCQLPEPRNQGACGACYAFAAATIASTRKCAFDSTKAVGAGSESAASPHFTTKARNESAASPQQQATTGAAAATTTGGGAVLATQKVVSCGSSTESRICLVGPEKEKMTKYSRGCEGGSPDHIFDYLAHEGLAVEACAPYISGEGKTEGPLQLTAGHAPSCTVVTTGEEQKADQCAAEKRVKLYDPIRVDDERSMQEALVEGGPIYATVQVYDDFVSKYKKGEIYAPGPDAKHIGGHAVVLFGFGEDRGRKYWSGVNSWGPGWGDKGTFKWERGKNIGEIERGAYFAHAEPAAQGGCADLTMMQHECIEKVTGDGTTCAVRNKCKAKGGGSADDRGQVRKVTVRGVAVASSESGKCGEITKTENIYPGETVEFPDLLYCCPTKDEFVETLGKACMDETGVEDKESPDHQDGRCVLKNTCDVERKRICVDDNSWVALKPNEVSKVDAKFCRKSNKCKRLMNNEEHTKWLASKTEQVKESSVDQAKKGKKSRFKAKRQTFLRRVDAGPMRPAYDREFKREAEEDEE